MTLPAGVIIDAYAISDSDAPIEIRIQRAQQMDGPDRWKVIRGSHCLSKRGDWVYEPLPSSRTDAFLKRCRFDDAGEAIAAAVKAHTKAGR